MPRYWLISDRNNNGTGTGLNNNGLSYFVSDAGPLNNIANWRRASPGSFKTQLAAAADQFPDLNPGQNESQSHVTILIHGFNVSFNSSTSFYQDLCGRLFDGPASMGLCILYDWPSQGTVAGYLPDRATARQCADDLTDILGNLFDWLIKKQKDAVTAAAAAVAGKTARVTPCKAKVSVIAHSMGNYVLQKAMAAAWTRKNTPINGFTQLDFADGGIEHAVYRKGVGPGVLEMHELPGLTLQCVDLVSRIEFAVFTVFLPFLKRKLGGAFEARAFPD
jgi:pimeloyl-ACP methyl ester carboxylesterase